MFMSYSSARKSRITKVAAAAAVIFGRFGAGAVVATSAQASECSFGWCGIVHSAKDSTRTVFVGSAWSGSASSGKIAALSPGQSSKSFMSDADGYKLMPGACAWWYTEAGTKQAPARVRGDGRWHQIHNSFNYTMHTYAC